MAQHLPIPILAAANLPNVTNAEWQNYSLLVTNWEAGETARLTAADPNAQPPAVPPEYLAHPANATTRLQAAMLMTNWMHTFRQAAIDAETANAAQQQAAAAVQAQQNAQAAQQAAVAAAQQQAQQQQAAAVAAAQQAAAAQQLAAVAAAQQNNPAIAALAQALQGALPAPGPGGPRAIKTALPNRFDGNPTKAKTFIGECANYFILNPMTPEQQVRFALQSMEGDAQQWKTTALLELNQQPPPAWEGDWDLFVREFNNRFEDKQERQKAINALMTGKVVQTTSVRKFLDQIMETCQKAGWNDPIQWLEVAQVGLKPEIAKAIADRDFQTWNMFSQVAIRVDEKFQQLKTKDTSSSSSKKTTTTGKPTPEKPKTDNSKYKLSEAERKEHVDQKLCFKCHKKGHASKDCKGERTVYSEFKKKQVAATTTEDPKGKGKQVAHVDEYDEKAPEYEEDFVEGD